MFSRKAMELSARSRRSHIWARVLGPSTRMAARRRMRRRLYPVAGRDCIRLPNMFSGGLATPVSMAQRAPVRQFWSTALAPKPALATTGGRNHPAGTLPNSPSSKPGFTSFCWARAALASNRDKQRRYMVAIVGQCAVERKGGRDNSWAQRFPWGKPWDRQPVSGKLRRKLGVSPGFAAYAPQERVGQARRPARRPVLLLAYLQLHGAGHGVHFGVVVFVDARLEGAGADGVLDRK